MAVSRGDNLVPWCSAISMLVFLATAADKHVALVSGRTLSVNDSTSTSRETGSRNLVTMKLAVILPFSGDHAWSLPRIKPAISLAADAVVSTSNSTSGLSLEFQINYGNSECSETMGPLAAIDMYLQGRADVFIGPACDTFLGLYGNRSTSDTLVCA